jgi:hypothetical protein
VNIKSQKDFFSGLMFMAVGVAFAWGATTYNVGTGARMGPGYFPLMLGILLAVLGSVITFKALVVETMGGDKIGAWAFRPPFFIIFANLIFGVCIGGLKIKSLAVPPLGLIVGIFLLVAIGSLADRINRIQDMVPGFFIAMPVTLIALLAAKIFPLLLVAAGLATSLVVVGTMVAIANYYFWRFLLPLIFPSLTENPKFKTGLLIYAFLVLALFLWRGNGDVALFLGSLLFKVFLVVGFILGLPKLAYKLGYKNKNSISLSLLITVLVCISVWAFIDILKLQMLMLPAFVTG